MSQALAVPLLILVGLVVGFLIGDVAGWDSLHDSTVKILRDGDIPVWLYQPLRDAGWRKQ